VAFRNAESSEELEEEVPLQLGLNLMQHSYQGVVLLHALPAGGRERAALPSRANEREKVRR